MPGAPPRPARPAARPAGRGPERRGRGGRILAGMAADARERVRGRLLRQAGACEDLGSPLSGLLLRAAADDVAAGGPTWAVLAPHAGGPRGDALALRLLAAVHRLVLERRAPALALHYPSVGGTAGPRGAGAAFLAAVAEHAAEIRDLVARPCQTNEVARAAALLGGFLAVARATRLPLRLLEIGASGGLLLRWDRYRYAAPGWSWGPAAGAGGLTLAGLFTRPPDPDPPAVAVAERRGCDPAPVDAATQEGRTTLTASVWPDQADRLARLRGALAVAAAVPAAVDREGVATWLPARLADPVPGVATVVYQSVVEQYPDEAERAARTAALDAAGARATAAAPLAWLRFEPRPATADFVLDLRTWPGGTTTRVATATAHGAGVVAR